MREIIVRGLAPNIKSAKTFLEHKDPVVYDILEEVTKNHPVLLNRAPTLHKLSILAFYPVLTDSYAIKLHPTVCAGYNADFDGDAMGLFVPLSTTAIEEVKTRMLPYQNLLKPSDGSPIVIPNKEMALGIYYLSTVDNGYLDKKDETLKAYGNEDEAVTAFHLDQINVRQPVLVEIKGSLIRTTVGRILVNQLLPIELQFINKDIKASDVKDLIVLATKIYADNQRLES